MNISTQLTSQFKAFYQGGNYTGVSIKETLKDVTWQEATTKVYGFNTIATLVYHINYYVRTVIEVLEGKPLNAKDVYSFDLPPINNKEDWEQLVLHLYKDAERMTAIIETLPDKKYIEIFVDEKYGSYYRNLHGIIEHNHYHLGQMVLIKKLLQSKAI